jgi:hypothetical protein
MAKSDFFLSFNRADRKIADLVHKTVTSAGFSCFCQHQDIVQTLYKGSRRASWKRPRC